VVVDLQPHNIVGEPEDVQVVVLGGQALTRHVLHSRSKSKAIMGIVRGNRPRKAFGRGKRVDASGGGRVNPNKIL
jgi:hypothetical protein